MIKRKLRVGIFCYHYGLANILANVIEGDDIEVRFQERLRGWAPHWSNENVIRGDEDIYITTLFNKDLHRIWCGEINETKQPTIYYFTDPVNLELDTDGRDLWKEAFDHLWDEEWFRVVLAEDCYPDIPPGAWGQYRRRGDEVVIPYAIWPPMSPKRPSQIRNRVAVVDRDPDRRWQEFQQRWWPGRPVQSLNEFFGDIPWTWVSGWDRQKLLTQWRQHRVLFHYNITPYSCTMFEAMTMGMPIVSANADYGGKEKPIEHYLYDYSDDPDELRAMLQKHLEKPVFLPVLYENKPSFDAVREQWRELFYEML